MRPVGLPGLPDTAGAVHPAAHGRRLWPDCDGLRDGSAGGACPCGCFRRRYSSGNAASCRFCRTPATALANWVGPSPIWRIRMMPVAFLGGITGVLYKQFAVTITISIAISAFVALTLTPALWASPQAGRYRFQAWPAFLPHSSISSILLSTIYAKAIRRRLTG